MNAVTDVVNTVLEGFDAVEPELATLARRFPSFGPFIGDALNLVFTFFALFWTIGLVLWPKHFDFPLTVFVASSLAMFVFKAVKSFSLYGFKIRAGFMQNIGASIAGLSLTHTVGKAVWSGLFTSNRPFLRTPKCEDQPAIIQGLSMAREEATLGGLLWLAAIAVASYIATSNASPAGATRWIRPSESASSASTRRPVSTISRARS